MSVLINPNFYTHVFTLVLGSLGWECNIVCLFLALLKPQLENLLFFKCQKYLLPSNLMCLAGHKISPIRTSFYDFHVFWPHIVTPCMI